MTRRGLGWASVGWFAVSLFEGLTNKGAFPEYSILMATAFLIGWSIMLRLDEVQP